MIRLIVWRLASRVIRLTTLLCLLALTAGCSNVIRSGLFKSNTIFLEPSTSRMVYLQPRNVSENQQVNLGVVGQKLSAKGYQLVTNLSRPTIGFNPKWSIAIRRARA